jgi:hypothetical protein
MIAIGLMANNIKFAFYSQFEQIASYFNHFLVPFRHFEHQIRPVEDAKIRAPQ